MFLFVCLFFHLFNYVYCTETMISLNTCAVSTGRRES